VCSSRGRCEQYEKNSPPAWLRTELDSGRVIAEPGISWTALRAARFHDLTLTTVEMMARVQRVR
jgi:hypothetical protein